ncbi:MAG: hypothetical protein V3U20_01920 [Thermoplasmata archaeon]
MSKTRRMSKIKYAALLAVAIMFISVMSVMSDKPPDMDPTDGITHAVPQYPIPPLVDGVVQVDITWPSDTFIGHMQVRSPPDNIDVAEVYMMFDVLAGYSRLDLPPMGEYGPDEEQGYYFYIGIKTLPGYSIPTGDPGAWVRIDWNQDGYIDFKDNNGNSATKGKPPHYTTRFAYTANGVEWAIPYIDDFIGVCESPFDIIVHIDVVMPGGGGGGGTDTATFPGDRPQGPFQSTTICVGDLISPEPPEEPGEWGIRTIGFWKHQINTALGISKGHQHVPTENLVYYLSEISTQSTVDELQDMDSDMIAALTILELRGKHLMYDRAVQQLLAVWLNYVSGNAQWDSDGDDDIDGADEYLIDVINWAEDILVNGDPADFEMVKDKLDMLNNSGE